MGGGGGGGGERNKHVTIEPKTMGDNYFTKLFFEKR